MADVLPVELTVGWPTGGHEGVDARDLHDLAMDKSFGKKSSHEKASQKQLQHLYEEALREQFQSQNIQRVNKLDQLLRRRRDWFWAIKHFTAALLKIKDELPQFQDCQIDIFAFAFLKYAKNFDLFMVHGKQSDLQETVKKWQKAVQALEDFERLGKDLCPDYNHLKEIYLKLRAAVSRPSARDEQRTLAVLLGSGPSTLDDISIDLGLHYSLNQRIMVALQETGAIESRGKGDDTLYLVTETALPVALFLVREIIGLDFLTMTASLWEER